MKSDIQKSNEVWKEIEKEQKQALRFISENSLELQHFLERALVEGEVHMTMERTSAHSLKNRLTKYRKSYKRAYSSKDHKNAFSKISFSMASGGLTLCRWPAHLFTDAEKRYIATLHQQAAESEGAAEVDGGGDMSNPPNPDNPSAGDEE